VICSILHYTHNSEVMQLTNSTLNSKTNTDLETNLWRKCRIHLFGIHVQSRCQRILTPRDLQYCPDGEYKRGWICEGQRRSQWALHLSGDRSSWPSHENGTIFRSI